MNAEIEAWLKSERDFEPGIELYMRYGQSNNLKRIFSRSEKSERCMDDLVYELSKCLHMETVHARKKTMVESQKPTGDQSFKTDFGVNGPDPARVLYQDIIRKIKIRDMIHSGLSGVMSQEKRKEDAFTIIQLSDEIRDGYERLKEFEKSGNLPPSSIKKDSKTIKHVLQLDREGLDKERSNVRSHISRNKKLSARQENTPAQVVRYTAALHFWQARLEDIEKALKNEPL